MEDILFALAVVGYLAIAMVWPAWRLWRRHGVWPVVFSREAAPGQRLLGLLSRLLFVAVVALAALHVFLGGDALGEWRLPAAARLLGWVLLGAGTALTVLAQIQMGASWRVGIDDRPTELVTGGLFRVVRNPIFTALLVFLAGFALLAAAWWSAGLWVLTALGLRVQVAHEEEHLRALHGAAYLDYASRVGRFIPLVGRLGPVARHPLDPGRT